jgi:hypothetical protein
VLAAPERLSNIDRTEDIGYCGYTVFADISFSEKLPRFVQFCGSRIFPCTVELASRGSYHTQFQAKRWVMREVLSAFGTRTAFHFSEVLPVKG